METLTYIYRKGVLDMYGSYYSYFPEDLWAYVPMPDVPRVLFKEQIEWFEVSEEVPSLHSVVLIRYCSKSITIATRVATHCFKSLTEKLILTSDVTAFSTLSVNE